MKFVATKPAGQLDLQALHRVRERRNRYLVGTRSHSLEQYYCYKFRGFWIPVALPPPCFLITA